MGFDILGISPKTKSGKVFLNNMAWWSLLWSYVSQNCSDILSPEQVLEGYSNDGVKIDAWQSELIAERLYSLLQNGEPKQIEDEVFEEYRDFPKIQCPNCEGSGLSEIEGKESELFTCEYCEGKGFIYEVSEGWHPFSADNLKNFADFCNQSGGFCIW
jgi:hypothetical protein